MFLQTVCLENFFQPCTLRCLSLSLRWVSCMQQNVGSCLCNQSVSLCLFIGVLTTLILRDIKEISFFLTVIFVVRVEILFMWLSSFRSIEILLCCFFSSLVSLLVLKFSLNYPLKGLICGKILCEFGFLIEYRGFSTCGN